MITGNNSHEIDKNDKKITIIDRMKYKNICM